MSFNTNTNNNSDEPIRNEAPTSYRVMRGDQDADIISTEGTNSDGNSPVYRPEGETSPQTTRPPTAAVQQVTQLMQTLSSGETSGGRTHQVRFASSTSKAPSRATFTTSSAQSRANTTSRTFGRVLHTAASRRSTSTDNAAPRRSTISSSSSSSSSTQAQSSSTTRSSRPPTPEPSRPSTPELQADINALTPEEQSRLRDIAAMATVSERTAAEKARATYMSSDFYAQKAKDAVIAISKRIKHRSWGGVYHSRAVATICKAYRTLDDEIEVLKTKILNIEASKNEFGTPAEMNQLRSSYAMVSADPLLVAQLHAEEFNTHGYKFLHKKREAMHTRRESMAKRRKITASTNNSESGNDDAEADASADDYTPESDANRSSHSAAENDTDGDGDE